MANTTLFRSAASVSRTNTRHAAHQPEHLLQPIPAANTLNQAGGTAYTMPNNHALAQYAVTGCLNNTFYASAEHQLEQILALCKDVQPECIAKTAVYARQHGLMKDVPALLCAVLSVADTGLLRRVFPRVIDNSRMLRTFVQIMRSGVVGRSSLGTVPKTLIANWFAERSDEAVFAASVGNNPSLADIIKMVHPKPVNDARRALYAYVIGREYNAEQLPEIVRHYEAFKRSATHDFSAVLNIAGNSDVPNVPNVPLQMLTALNLSREQWKQVALQSSWQTLRMNLNTFARHGVFDDANVVKTLAKRLAEPDAVRSARVFPYQLLMAYTAASGTLPNALCNALQDALEYATENVPALEGQVVVCVDVSGSMQSPATGYRKGSTSAVRCIDVAALVAASILRSNPDALIVPFEQNVVRANINPRDSVMTNAQKLAAINGGGTNCRAALRHLNAQNINANLVLMVSDNESWIDSVHLLNTDATAQSSRPTPLMQEWQHFRTRNPAATLVCLDIQPNKTLQAVSRPDIMNIGGFSDHVFSVISDVAAGRNSGEHWATVIEAVEL
jgi:60 kDa SS-A/Ro ribonucleoprotein